ncbi:putative oxalocrotonate tautomerase [Paraphoma chrysanthemicola]|uniref:Oxalocrotonate tautomerase n=1 Tax=Paraphoma chrysanthemicola TaxID=798071 RepID=A0A8K0RBS6_9PLEO|nr:putative oxalocrotonate tautomerase [Paraphoma chrysanthemicola]
MPLWLIFHTEDTFQDVPSKRAVTQDITKIYTSIGLPPFYVVVNFIKMATGDQWIGGEIKSDKPFVRVAIEHIAVNLPNEDAVYDRTARAIDKALKPHVADKGYDWEFHIDETDRRLWKVNGLIPPAWKSEQEKIWFKENRPVPYPEGE